MCVLSKQNGGPLIGSSYRISYQIKYYLLFATDHPPTLVFRSFLINEINIAISVTDILSFIALYIPKYQERGPNTNVTIKSIYTLTLPALYPHSHAATRIHNHPFFFCRIKTHQRKYIYIYKCISSMVALNVQQHSLTTLSFHTLTTTRRVG